MQIFETIIALNEYFFFLSLNILNKFGDNTYAFCKMTSSK